MGGDRWTGKNTFQPEPEHVENVLSILNIYKGTSSGILGREDFPAINNPALRHRRKMAQDMAEKRVRPDV